MAILFEKDWRNQSNQLVAIPHVSTKNDSFLRTCQLLKRMGIKNYAFPLCLYDPDLKYVDVHDLEDNTPENEILRIKVQIEARKNTWYFLRECIRIYEQGGAPIPFRLDRGSCAMTWCWLNGLDYTGMQPRQTGKEQPLYANVLTDRGWIKMGEVDYTTKVITPGGDTANVVGIYPQGIKDIYRITLESGATADCGVEHLWNAYCDRWETPFSVVSFQTIQAETGDVYLPILGTLEKITAIDYIGQHEAQCIEIDHPDHLYITDNNIVTHNTVCALSLIASILYSSGYEYTVGGMAKDNDLRQENVKRVKAFGDNLPSWWLLRDRYKDKTNAEELFYNEYRTHYVTFVAQKEKAAADKQGRGGSMPMMHFDELEYTANIGTSYPTMMSSGSTARENAKKNGKPHSNIITTTAGDPSTPPCKEAAKILEGAMPFTEQLYDIVDNDTLHKVVAASSPQKMVLGVFSHLQLGKDNEWLRDRIKRGRMTVDQVKRDFLNQRVSIAETPIIPKETLALITASEKEVRWFQIINDKFGVSWYIPREEVQSPAFKERSIVVGCDSSEMIGRDATTLVGVDPRTLETVFTFRCSEGNINVVGVMIAQLLLEYPKMIFVPENKSSGTAIIDNVSLILRKARHNPFFRMFNWIIQNKHEREFEKYDLRDQSLLDSQAKRYFGIKTDAGKRDELYGSTLLQASERASSKVRDRTLIQELSSLTVRNGRVDHAVGGHDDSVVAWLLAMWFILNGKNLSEYGIKPGTVLSFANPAKPDKNRLSEERQAKIRDRIVQLTQLFNEQSDPSMQRLVQAEIKLMRTLVTDGPLPTPDTSDDLNRDPRKYTDQSIVEQSRRPVSQDEVSRTLHAIFGARVQ